MAQVKAKSGFIIGTGIALSVLAIAAASVMTGDVHLRLAGLDVKIQNQTERGLVVLIDGAECPGSGCPAIALDWKLVRQG